MVLHGWVSVLAGSFEPSSSRGFEHVCNSKYLSSLTDVSGTTHMLKVAHRLKSFDDQGLVEWQI